MNKSLNHLIEIQNEIDPFDLLIFAAVMGSNTPTSHEIEKLRKLVAAKEKPH